MTLPYLDRLRGMRFFQGGVPVANAGRVFGANFLNSTLAYNPATGVVDITVGVGDIPIVALTGAANTLALVQAHKLLTVSHTSTTTVTVPPNASVAFPVGTLIRLVQTGAGPLVLAPDFGVTIRTPQTLRAQRQYSLLYLYKIATNEWVLDGDLLPLSGPDPLAGADLTGAAGTPGQSITVDQGAVRSLNANLANNFVLDVLNTNAITDETITIIRNEPTPSAFTFTVRDAAAGTAATLPASTRYAVTLKKANGGNFANPVYTRL